MQPQWDDMTSATPDLHPGALMRDGVHAIAMRRQLDWAEDFARAGDLASAIDALRDAGALAQELADPLADTGVDRL
jgi:hypothetical protein